MGIVQQMVTPNGGVLAEQILTRIAVMQHGATTGLLIIKM